MIKITACIITLNEELSIRDCLKSISWCDEIIVIDSGSTDQTVSICEAEGCKVIYNKFDSFSSQRQFASDNASHDWILSIDADERLCDSLINEIKSAAKNGINEHAAYNIKFRTYVHGKLMNSCGMRKEKHIRLYNRKKARFANSSVHEYLQIDGSVGLLKHHIVHFTYSNLYEHLEKLNRYTELWSCDRISTGKRTTIFKVAIQFPVKFIQFFIIKLGFIDGYYGFVFSFLHGVYGTMKYAKLLQKQNNR